MGGALLVSAVSLLLCQECISGCNQRRFHGLLQLCHASPGNARAIALTFDAPPAVRARSAGVSGRSSAPRSAMITPRIPPGRAPSASGGVTRAPAITANRFPLKRRNPLKRRKGIARHRHAVDKHPAGIGGDHPERPDRQVAEAAGAASVGRVVCLALTAPWEAGHAFRRRPCPFSFVRDRFRPPLRAVPGGRRRWTSSSAPFP